MYYELVKRLREVEEMLKVAQFKKTANLIEQAADAIEQLSNAGSAYGRGWTLGYDAGRKESKPRWISAEEMLPKDLQNVLVIDDGRVTIGHCEHYYCDEQICVEWHDTLYYPIDPPYWQPLPEPPKEET